MVGNVQVTAVGSTNICCHADTRGAGVIITLPPPNVSPVVVNRFDASVVCFGPGHGGGGGPAAADSEFALAFHY
jgi:hypothetical protein